MPILNAPYDYQFFDGVESIQILHKQVANTPEVSVDFCLFQHPSAVLAGGSANAMGDEVVFQVPELELTHPIGLNDRITRPDGLKYCVDRITPNPACGMFEVVAHKER